MRRRSSCAPLAQLVVRTSFLPCRPSNELTCLILIMCLHCTWLSLIVSHRMLFVDRYFHRASGCRGVAQCLHMAWVWAASGKSRGRSEDVAEASNDGALPVLLAAHPGHTPRTPTQVRSVTIRGTVKKIEILLCTDSHVLPHPHACTASV